MTFFVYLNISFVKNSIPKLYNSTKSLLYVHLNVLYNLFTLQGDIILEVPYLIEFVTKFINISGNYKLLNINKLGVNQT